jgi:hypothetical protein
MFQFHSRPPSCFKVHSGRLVVVDKQDSASQPLDQKLSGKEV